MLSVNQASMGKHCCFLFFCCCFFFFLGGGGVQSIDRLFLDFDRRQIRLVDCTDCRTPEIIRSLTLHVNRHVPYLYSVTTKLVKNRRKNKGVGGTCTYKITHILAVYYPRVPKLVKY